MKELSLSVDAQTALVKFLVRLNILGQGAYSHSYLASESAPISYFAGEEMLDEDVAIKAVSEKLGIPWIRIDSKEKVAKFASNLDHGGIGGVSPEKWQAIKTVPIEITERYIQIAMANPLDDAIRKTLALELSCEVRVAVAREKEILTVIQRRLGGSKGEDLEELLTLDTDASNEISSRRGFSGVDSGVQQKVGVEDPSAPPVIKLVNRIITQAVSRGASDVHLNPEKDELVVRLRIDGLLQQLLSVPRGMRDAVVSRIKIMAGMDISERRKPQDGRLRVQHQEGTVDLRISTVPTYYGENVVIRILKGDVSRLTFEALGFDKQARAEAERIFKGTSRVVLVAGPTGVGKTSTLYAGLLSLRDGKNNIVTIEDPIEYRISGINQMQVNSKIGVSFADGLRSLLRQDPDVIMIGEIRDTETAEIAMQAAQTGHLVLSTIHANSCVSAITRLRDLGVPSYLIASSLGGVISQRLVRTICQSCWGRSLLSDDYALAPVEEDGNQNECEECGGSGWRGRLGIFSILEIGDEVREGIRVEVSEGQLEGIALGSGMISMEERALELLEKGVTTEGELERVLGSRSSWRLRRDKSPVSLQLPSAELLKVVDLERRDGESSTIELNRAIPRRKVLLVEDDENTRMILALLLEREMFQVEEAVDGLEALEKVYQQPPEIIICDLMMPRMNGMEFVKKMRADPRFGKIPVLMLTAADVQVNEIGALEGGADDFVGKTAESAVLMARVHRLLARTAS